MGYSCYELDKVRDSGYGVPAYCDHPDCDEKIDRGMAHCCGSEPFSEYGCGLYFCSKHLLWGRVPRGTDRYVQNCYRCSQYKKPYKPKPEHPEWMRHKLKDPSWNIWRNNNRETVLQYKQALKELKS